MPFLLTGRESYALYIAVDFYIDLHKWLYTFSWPLLSLVTNLRPVAPYTVKKGKRVSRPQPGCHLPNSPWTGIIKLFLAWRSLVSDIPAGDGKIANLYLQCTTPYRSLIYIYIYISLSKTNGEYVATCNLSLSQFHKAPLSPSL